MEPNPSYDEDLLKNVFFLALREQYPDLLHEICSRKYLLCIPKKGSMSCADLDVTAVKAHVLRLSEEDDSGCYVNLNNDIVNRTNGCLVVDSTSSESVVDDHSDSAIRIVSPVLFQETNALPSGQIFTALCIGTPLIPGCRSPPSINGVVSGSNCIQNGSSAPRPRTYSKYNCEERSIDCYEFILFGSDEDSDLKLRRELDSLLRSFAERIEMDFRLSPIATTPEQLSDAAREEFYKIWTKLCQRKYQKDGDPPTDRQIELFRLSVEIYFFHYLHEQIWAILRSFLRKEEARFNKVLASLSNLQPSDLVENVLFESLPSARKELKKISNEPSPYGKLLQLRKTIRTLHVSGVAEANHNSSHSSQIKFVFSPDKLLPALCYLVVKCGLCSWMTNLYFMQHFHFCDSSGDELSYCLASFQAAVQYLMDSEQHLKSVIMEKLTCLPCQNSFKKEGIEQSKERMRQRLRNSESVSAELSSSYGVEAFWSLVIEAVLLDGEDIICSLFRSRRVSECEYATERSDSTASKIDDEIDQSIQDCGQSHTALDDSGIIVDSIICHPLCTCETCKTRQKMDTLICIDRAMYGGFTALHLAAAFGKAHVVDALCKMNADVNVTNDFGQTPLHLAASSGNQRCLLLLLHCGSIATNMDHSGNTACVKALLFSLSLEANQRSTALVNMKNLVGDSALHIACRVGSYELAGLLLENGASAKIRNKKDQLALDFCEAFDLQNLIRSRCKLSSNKVEQRLLSSFVHAETGNFERSSTMKECDKMLKAVRDNDIPLVHFYLGCPLDQAEQGNVASSSPCHPLCQCEKCVKVSSELLDVNCVGSNGLTAIHEACEAGLTEMVEVLLKLGANVNHSVGHFKLTPLHCAVSNGSSETVILLMSEGADVRSLDGNGRSALHYACGLGYKELVNILMKAGADPNQTDSIGNTPLHEAAKGCYKDVIKILLKANARKDVFNDVQLLPMDLARTKAVISLLK